MSCQSSNKKRFYIHTLGCKVNQYESQAMRESLLNTGFEESSSKDVADVFVLNTCTVTEKADKESRYLVNAFCRANPGAKIVVTGCYVEKNSSEVAALPGVAYIVKNEEKSRLADILNGVPSDKNSTQLKITGFKGHSKAFVKIQDGCENGCAYCKVPLVRGPLKSRPLNLILDEVEGLVKNGFKEIVLTGICLGAWGRECFSDEDMAAVETSGRTLADVLRALERIKGDFRIRLSSIEPKYVTDDIIAIMRRSRKICRHLHIPLQSGDDGILKSMNRPYTSAEYRALAEKARAEIDGLAITTDVMVGFPGESSANFNNTLDFVRELSPARTHIFTFSRRPGTAAYSMDGAIDPSVSKDRHQEMDAVALNAAHLFARSSVGGMAKILVENKRDADSGLLTGYSDNYIKVLFPGPDDLMGRIVPVRIIEAGPVTTSGVYEE